MPAVLKTPSGEGGGLLPLQAVRAYPLLMYLSLAVQVSDAEFSGLIFINPDANYDANNASFYDKHVVV
jgi:hypothetical protein